MTLFDVIVIGVLLISSVLALLRGLTNELLSIFAWVVGALLALWLFPYVTPLVREVVSPPWLASVLSALGIFIAGYVVCAALTLRWSDSILDLHHRAELLDRTLGFAFGLARGLLIVTIAYLFFTWLVPNRTDQPDWIRNARLRPMVEDCASWLFSLAPQGYSPASPDRARAYPGNSAPSQPPQSPATNQGNDTKTQKSDADTDKDAGYNTSERRGLDRLFENTTGQ
ncbi:MAG: CvpA family protein [Parvibaculum sp.]